MTDKKFKPSEHLTNIKGKDYLEVKWRLVWFREEHPDWEISTEEVSCGQDWSKFKATVKNPEGKIIATGHKVENKQGFPDFTEKAETGSIGRALALCGYGTQFAPELEEGERLADSPVERKTNHVDHDPIMEATSYSKEKEILNQLAPESDTRICTIHDEPMTRRISQKTHKPYYAHSTPSGLCFGSN